MKNNNHSYHTTDSSTTSCSIHLDIPAHLNFDLTNMFHVVDTPLFVDISHFRRLTLSIKIHKIEIVLLC